MREIKHCNQNVSFIHSPLADCQWQLRILILGKVSQTQALLLLLDGLYSVTVIDDPKNLNQTVNEEDFSLIIIFPANLAISGQKCVKHLKANPFCGLTPILVVLPEQEKYQEFSIIEAGAIDCLIAPTKPILLCSKIKNHLVLAKHTRQLEIASSIDGLTGLNNRIQLDSVLFREWFNAKRSKHVISALMVGIDFFKLYNDAYGHLQGDECLKQIAAVVRQAKRRGSDFAARFGGEEFVMLLPFTDRQGAEKLANELINSVHQLNITSAVSDNRSVSISVGISTCHPHLIANDGDNPWQLIKEADTNLYKAKQTGRNKYCA
jgi:diguanylate cyclase (GGDEF)-like protein